MTTAATEDTTGKQPDNLLGMSDEDFLKMESPPPKEPVTKTQEELDAEAAAAEQSRKDAEAEAARVAAEEGEETEAEKAARLADEEAATATSTANSGSNSGKVESKDGNVSVNSKVDKDGKKVDASVSADTAAAAASGKDGAQKVDPKAATTADGKTAAETTTPTVNYEQVYKQIMAPFKANGKTIELKSPEEAIQLMQMGANYTRKMQDIQPHRKTLLMLEKNGLMDPDKLSFLIDIDKGNPEAIKKLLKDKGVNPMDIDTEAESTYLGGNHKVSDAEATFQATLDELSSNPEGQKTLQVINSTWDQASKEVLWSQPDVMKVMHDQRENGIYDRIESEVNRLRTLGQIPAGTSFLQAYKAVGDVMAQNGAFKDLAPAPVGSSDAAGKLAAATTAAEPVATRVAAPKPAVANGDQASAAAATRSTPRKAEKVVNPLAMSDDDFLKQMANRV